MKICAPGAAAAALLLTLTPVCSRADQIGPPSGPPAPASFENAWRSARAAGIDLWDAARWREPLTALYRARGYAPLWLDLRGWTPAVAAMLGEIAAAAERGLDPADYDGALLRAALSNLDTATADASDVLQLDLALSVAAARLVSDLHAGRIDPRRAGHDLAVPHSRLDVQTAVRALTQSRDLHVVLDDFEPGFHHYDLLKRALRRYRALMAEPDLARLPPLPGRSLDPGAQYGGAVALRRLLRAFGDLESGPDDGSTLLDAALVAALRRFQERHGLEPDGKLGKATYAALTVPLESRVRQIELSLERSRWLPPQLEAPPIIVNIPQFRLFAFSTTRDNEGSLLIMDVIVGKTFPRNNTPVFAADLRYIVLRPYWDVPRSILIDELMPKIRANPAWLERNRFEIVRGPGDDATIVAASSDNIEALARGELRLREKPGPRNSLGLAKFMLPNNHNVYLHGTPAESLFLRARRAFSHGCVRVADPLALASFILRDDPQWSAERILAQMNADGGPTRISLKTPIRVFMLYATALVTESGRVLFFEDIYRHDVRLIALLRKRRG
jgi:murein L,D-transpeptidase YcbB/YkuD